MSATITEKDLEEVKSQGVAAENEIEKTYDDMISSSQSKYDEQIQASKDWVTEQKKLQNESYGLEKKEIEQQKADAKKDYLKEQSGAYTDWQKQSNKYGAEAERQASMGMANSGYSESSQVSMYNAYQNRVAVAREAFVRAETSFNLAIDRAKLQNDTLLAEIAYKGLQEQLTLAIESMQYKNSLVVQKSQEKRAVNSDYYNRWINMYSQLKQQQQFEANLAFQKEQFAWQKAQANEGSGGSINKGGSAGGTFYSEPIGPQKKEDTGSKSTKKDDEYKVDMISLTKLGYAGKSAKEINSLVERGVLREVVNHETKTISYVYGNPLMVSPRR